MKKCTFVAGLVALLTICPVWAQSDTTLNGVGDASQLGMMAGLALACDAGAKLDDYELIAARILSNQAQTKANEKKSAKEFAEAKFNAFQKQKQAPEATCGEILESFNHLSIFKSVVYADGTVKLPNGQFLKPRKGAVIEKPKSKEPNKTPTAPTKKAVKKPNTPTKK